MKRRDVIRGGAALAALSAAPLGSRAQQSAQPAPNILLILAEDIGPQFGCYGDRLARTPNADRLASEGALFTHAYTSSPVCSPSRSALMTGMYQTAINAHNHRTRSRPPLPDGVRTLTAHLRGHGYFTANVGAGNQRDNTLRTPGDLGSGKTDLNFSTGEPLFDGRDWNERGTGQPFFAQLTLRESHRGEGWVVAREQAVLTDPAQVEVPPYFPDHPVVRDELANYYDAVSLVDFYLGRVLERLEREGLADRTVVIFMGDNGACLVRGKQWCYDAGIHVPLIVRWPDRLNAGTVDDRLVSGVDLAPTILGMAGAGAPSHMHGQDIYGAGYTRRDHVIAARDRCDIAAERIRCVRTARYKYIRNYMPNVPYMQTNPYKSRDYPTFDLLRQLHAAGELNEDQEKFLADRKPIEELYDLREDPHELNNLAGREDYKGVLEDLRGKLDRWVARYPDLGRVGEDPLDIFASYFRTLELDAVADDRREVARQVYAGTAS